MAKPKSTKLVHPVTTGWPPGMLQDDCRELSKWLASRIDSMKHAREAVQLLLNSK